MELKKTAINFLEWSQKYTKTDMTYVAKGVFWWMIGKAVVFFIYFATMAAFANWLSKETFGTYQFVVAGLTLFGIFTLPEVNTTLIKSIAQGKEGTFQLAIKNKMKWGAIGGFLSLGLAGWYFLHGNNLLAIAFLLVALFVPLKQTFQIFIYFWNGKKRFDLRAKYEIVYNGLVAFFLIATVYLTDNVLIIIITFLAGYTFFGYLLCLKIKSQIANKEEDPKAISFGKNLTLINALQTATEYVDKIIVWHFLGAVPVAIYTFANQPIQKIKEALPIVPLALPKLGESKIDEKKKKGIITKFLRLFIIAVPATVILVLTAPFLYQLFFPQYMESVVYFQTLAWLIALSPFLLLTAALITEMNKKALFITNTGAPFLKIILFLALIPHFGIWGIIAAILITEVLRGLFALYFFLRI